MSIVGFYLFPVSFSWLQDDRGKKLWGHPTDPVGVYSAACTEEHIEDSKWIIVYGCHGGDWTYYIEGIGGGLDTLYHGEGYWVYCETG